MKMMKLSYELKTWRNGGVAFDHVEFETNKKHEIEVELENIFYNGTNVYNLKFEYDGTKKVEIIKCQIRDFNEMVERKREIVEESKRKEEEYIKNIEEQQEQQEQEEQEMNETVYYKSKYDIKKELDAIAPEDDYRNGIIAKGISIGKKDKLNDDWVRRAVLTDWDEGFINDYDTALRLYHIYNNYLKKTFVKVR